jgi:uncharacterized protein (DUF2141 family)
MSRRTFALRFAACIALSLVGAMSAAAQSANRIEVAVQGIRNDNGSVRCGLYSSAATFPKNGKQFMGVAVPIANRTATCVFNDVPPGKYAVAAFHAEQNETEMQYNWLGAPKEGYGFSRDASGFMGPPDFSDAVFDYENGVSSQTVKLDY